MTDYYRSVTLPALREKPAGTASALPRKLRKGLADDGRWLDDDKRASSCRRGWPSVRSMATLVEYRARLAQVLDERSHDAAGHAGEAAGVVQRGRGQRHPRAAGILRAAEGLRAGAGARLTAPELAGMKPVVPHTKEPASQGAGFFVDRCAHRCSRCSR